MAGLESLNMTLVIDDMMNKMAKHDIKKSLQALLKNKEVSANIQAIQKICNEKYAAQGLLGATSLNRLILLDENIAILLTIDTIKALILMKMQNKSASVNEKTPSALKRLIKTGDNKNKSIYTYTTIFDAIYHAFEDDIKTIKTMTNNLPFRQGQYDEQKKAYEKITLTTVRTIASIAKDSGVNISDAKYQTKSEAVKIPLSERLDNIAAQIKVIQIEREDEKLLSTNKYSAANMRNQTVTGVKHIFTEFFSMTVTEENGKVILKPNPNKPEGAIKDLSDLAQRFINNDKYLLDTTVIHFFYDRAHLEAGIASNITFSLNGKDYTYLDIIREMTRQCEAHPEAKTANEQFNVRLSLVENDLRKRFPDLKQSSQEYSLEVGKPKDGKVVERKEHDKDVGARLLELQDHYASKIHAAKTDKEALQYKAAASAVGMCIKQLPVENNFKSKSAWEIAVAKLIDKTMKSRNIQELPAREKAKLAEIQHELSSGPFKMFDKFSSLRSRLLKTDPVVDERKKLK